MQKRGHLYWARVDKQRPVLVVSVDARNERANDVIVIPCSTTMRVSPTHVFLKRGEGGLPEDCVLKCEQVTTLAKGDIDLRPLGGPLAAGRMAQMERGVFRAIGIPIY